MSLLARSGVLSVEGGGGENLLCSGSPGGSYSFVYRSFHANALLVCFYTIIREEFTTSFFTEAVNGAGYHIFSANIAILFTIKPPPPLYERA